MGDFQNPSRYFPKFPLAFPRVTTALISGEDFAWLREGSPGGLGASPDASWGPGAKPLVRG